jgi:hypothetical protein
LDSQTQKIRAFIWLHLVYLLINEELFRKATEMGRQTKEREGKRRTTNENGIRILLRSGKRDAYKMSGLMYTGHVGRVMRVSNNKKKAKSFCNR